MTNKPTPASQPTYWNDHGPDSFTASQLSPAPCPICGETGMHGCRGPSAGRITGVGPALPMPIQPSPARSDMLDAERALSALRSIRDTAAFDASPSGDVFYRKAENALAAIEGRDAAAKQAERAPSGESQEFENYFCNTLSCDGSESEELIEACRVAAQDAWMERARRATAGTTAPEKPFAGPGAWFSVDVLGNPMRQYAPGKWENAIWPSERATAGNAAPTCRGCDPAEGFCRVCRDADQRASNAATAAPGDCGYCEGGKGAHDGGCWVECPWCKGTGRASNAGAAPGQDKLGLMGYCHTMSVGKFINDGREADVWMHPRSAYPDGPKDGDWMHPVYVGKPFPATPSINPPVGAAQEKDQ